MSSIDIARGVRRYRLGSRSGTREQEGEARWTRPALVMLLAATAMAYTWDLSASGYANSFYAAAVQAGTESWKAFFFGSLDSSSFITVDKPPAALWLMALSGRIFGFGSWSMLVPQALEGVAAVGLLYATVRRPFGAPAGLAAGALLALTPVAALMFRFNNPDALLVATLVASAYTLTRAIEHASTRWMLATGALIGFAFLTKMGQALLVVPGFALAYAIAAPTTLRRRLAQLGGGFAALVLTAGWWVAIVALLPAGSRPFIDGSPSNNIFNLIFGYNGFSRLFGSGGPPGAGAASGGNFSGAAGILRLFNPLLGGQASWLLPAAIVALLVGAVVSRHTARTDRERAALIVWGGWLLVTAAVFSFSTGVIHTYYTVALAPAIAALVAIGAVTLWRRRSVLWARWVASATVLGTGAWAFVLLDRTPHWEPWLRPLIIAAAVVAAVCILALPGGRRAGRAALAFTAACAATACLAGPLAYAAQTVSSVHSGSIPSAGPATDAGAGFAGPLAAGRARAALGGPAGGTVPSGAPGAGAQAAAGGVGPSGGFPSSAQRGFSRRAPAGHAARSGGVPTAGGLGGQLTPSSELTATLERSAGRYRWVAATDGSSSAAALELATGGEPVMAIGGFNNNGGLLTLAQFEHYVARGAIHYFIAAGGGGTSFGSSSVSAITNWVRTHFDAESIGGVTVYDLAR